MPGLLVFLAHPDDEFFCAGLIAACTKQGMPVHLVYWTRGEGGLSPRRRFLSSLFHPMSHPRVKETDRAAIILGVASLTFFNNYQDPVSTQGLRAPQFDRAVFREQILEVAVQHRPEWILTHGSDGDYGHPAHQELNLICRDIFAEADGPLLLSFNADWPDAPPAQFRNRSDSADHVFDSRPFSSIKQKVLEAHRSQKAVFESLLPKLGNDPDELTRYEGYRIWSTADRKPLADKLWQTAEKNPAGS